MSYTYLTARLVDISGAYDTEVNNEKTKMMIRSSKNIESTMSGQSLEQVDAIKYLVPHSLKIKGWGKGIPN